jgi:hypothetical protein
MRIDAATSVIPPILVVLMAAPQALALDDLATKGMAPSKGGAAAQEDLEGEESFSFSLDLDVVNQYVWRGHLFDSRISPQPSLTVGYALSERNKVDFNAWWNFAADDHGVESHRDELFEQDFTLTFTHSLSDRFDVSLGYVYWSHPRSSLNWQTDEVFLGLTYYNGNLTLDTTLYSDVDKVKGQYLDVRLATLYGLSERLSLETVVGFGVAYGQTLNPDKPLEFAWFLKDGLVEQSVGVNLGYELTRNLSVGASLNFTSRLDGYRAATGQGERYLWGGLSLGFVF